MTPDSASSDQVRKTMIVQKVQHLYTHMHMRFKALAWVTTEECRELLLKPNKKSFFGLVRLLLEGRAIDNDSAARIPLFVRFCCLLKDSSMLSPGCVSCLCAQVIYLMKLSVLEIVKAETSDENKKIKN